MNGVPRIPPNWPQSLAGPCGSCGAKPFLFDWDHWWAVSGQGPGGVRLVTLCDACYELLAMGKMRTGLGYGGSIDLLGNVVVEVRRP